jgi:hypothetical protein
MSAGRRILDVFRNTAAEADDEIAFHLEMRERDFRARGLGPLEAPAAARRRFGDAAAVARQVRAIDAAIAKWLGSPPSRLR